MEYAISLKQVSKRYKRGRESVEVLSSLSLDIPPHAFVALMGPSGSGKTTLLNLIGGLDKPDQGEITVAGERLDRLSEGKLCAWRADNVGFIFQFYNLMPMISAKRNVELPLLLTRLPRKEREQRVAIALDIVGLGERAKHRPNELSGGQQQRVAIARALVADPAVLVCDEPTGDLDRKAADDVLALLCELNENMGKTIVMVTHDQRAAAAAKSQMHLDKGRLTAANGEAP